MKVWAVAVVLVAAVLAEKVLARPGAEEDEEGYQEDAGEGEQSVVSPAETPVLRSQPQILTPKPGDTVWLPCDADTAPTYIWLNGSATIFLNNLRLTYKDDKRLVFHKNHTLEIRHVQPTDSNEYTCKLSTEVAVVHRVNVFDPNTAEVGNRAPSNRIAVSLLLGSMFFILFRT